MKSFSKLLLTSCLSVGLFASTTFAAAGDISSPTTASLSLPVEAKAAAAAVTNQDFKAVQYELNTALAVGTEVKLELPAGVVFAAEPILELISKTDNAAANESSAPTFTKIAGGVGVSTALFKVATNAVPTVDDDGDALALLVYTVMSTSNTETSAVLDLTIASGDLSAGDIEATLTVTDAVSNPTLSKTGKVTIATVADQVTCKVDTAASDDDGEAVVDVDEDRKKFKASATDGTATTVVLELDASKGTVSGNFAWTLTLTGDFSGVSSIAESGTSGTFTANEAKTVYTLKGDQSDFASLTNITITVDGTTVLSTRKIAANLSVDFTDDAAWKDETVFVAPSAFNWGINGAQFVVTRLLNKTYGDTQYKSFMTFKTTGAAEVAEMFINLNDSEGNTAMISKTIPATTAGGYFEISASDLMADAAAASLTSGLIGAEITVTLPKEQVSMNAYTYNYATGDYSPVNFERKE